MRILVVLSALLVAALARPSTHDYLHGAQVLRVNPTTAAQVHYLQGLQNQDLYDFWTEPHGTGLPVDIMAQAFSVPVLKKTLQTIGLEFTVQVSDVALLLAKDREANQKARASSGREMDWTSYHRYDEIEAWLEELATTNPGLCSVEEIGTTYEGRTMKMLTLGKGGAGKPGIFIDGGIHAREWISPATVTYMLNELVTNSATYDDLLSNVNFYFIPSINPDGYEYCHTDDRLWRKTRSDNGSPFGCMGADPNRNWGFHWNENGASNNPCSDIYAGPEAFSEVEMRNVRDQILKYADSLVVYLTFHSYSQLWLYPWGYTSALPSDWQDLDDLAHSAVDALTAVHGTRYDIGSSTNVLYAAAGGSDDWAKGGAGVKYAYTVELRDTGNYGFVLPPDQIIPTGEETFEALKVVANYVRNNYS
ncbi:carboxypeptidase B-like [Penaeus japonicus]|uniref:carboxypeptidase B-like n=1 Tax=Penaeus japonicus TaxID=27405 RepID=UPI001C70F476|nr:carboxypeptidase B-like [Penaeus japonicus]